MLNRYNKDYSFEQNVIVRENGKAADLRQVAAQADEIEAALREIQTAMGVAVKAREKADQEVMKIGSKAEKLMPKITKLHLAVGEDDRPEASKLYKRIDKLQDLASDIALGSEESMW